MKCPKCGEEMYSLVSEGSSYVENKYVCPQCHYKPDNSITVTNYGWICPKCGAVLSPSIQECPYCTPHKVTCGTINEFPIKPVPTTDVTSQPQVNTKAEK